MNIALIYPPISHKSFEEDIDIVSREFGIFPPLGLAYAAAVIEKAGNKSCIIDANAEQLSKNEVLIRINEFKADMLGFMLTAYGFFDTLRWVRFLKKHTQLPVLAGNVLCSMYPEQVLRYAPIDYIIIGPAIEALPRFIQAVENRESLHGIPGLGWRENGEIRISEPLTMEEDFNRLPFPARGLLPNEKYHAVMSKRKNYTIMVTSKGCTGSCVFCHIHKIPMSFRSEDLVVAEIEECFHNYNIREMDIFDPSFTMLKNRVYNICDGILKKNIDIHWACRARVDQVDSALLSCMQRAGCRRILYGIESGVNDNLKNMKKEIVVEQAMQAVALTKKSGIQVLGFFMLGVPGETLESIRQTIAYSRAIGVDYAQYHRVMAKPDTELNKAVTEALGFDYWREYIRGCVFERRLPTPWTEVPDDVLQRMTKYAYLTFYFRPLYLLKLIRGVKSWGELKRYIRSAVGLLLSRRDKKKTIFQES